MCIAVFALILNDTGCSGLLLLLVLVVLGRATVLILFLFSLVEDFILAGVEASVLAV